MEVGGKEKRNDGYYICWFDSFPATWSTHWATILSKSYFFAQQVGNWNRYYWEWHLSSRRELGMSQANYHSFLFTNSFLFFPFLTRWLSDVTYEIFRRHLVWILDSFCFFSNAFFIFWINSSDKSLFLVASKIFHYCHICQISFICIKNSSWL